MKVRDMGYDAAIRRLKDLGRSEVVIGWPEGEGSATSPQLAYWQNYGTLRNGKQHIPPRPYFDQGIKESIPKINKTAEIIYDKVVDGSMGAQQGLEVLGNVASDEVRDYIVKHKIPPNAASTIRQKGFNNPWVHTGKVVNDLTYQVREG